MPTDLPRAALPAPPGIPVSGRPLEAPLAGGAGLTPDDWRRYVAAIQRRKWIVLGVTLAGTALGVWAKTRLGPQYLARAVLWVEVANARERAPDPLGAGGLLGATGWVDLLRSHAVLDEVVREERLYLAPASPEAAAGLRDFRLTQPYHPGTYQLTVAKDGNTWTLARHPGAVQSRGTVGDSIGGALGFLWAPAALPPGSTVEFTVTSHYEAARRLAKELRVVTELGGNFIRLELKGDRPDRVAAILNAVAGRFVAVATDLKREKQSELARIFGEQLQHARQNLSRAEAALRAFRIGAAPLLAAGAVTGPTRGGADPALTTYLEIRGEHEDLQRDRRAIERILVDAGDSTLSVDALGLIAAVQRSPELSLALRELTSREAELRTLRYRYTDDNPEVRRLAGQVAGLQRVTIPALARALTGELATRETDIARRVDSASGDLRRLPALVIEDARLRRDVASAEEVFTRIQQRYGEAQLAEVSSLPDVRILDAAVPPEVPLTDVGLLLIVLAAVGSFGVGALGAVALERFDRTVQDPGQVTQGFGLRILGALPHVRPEGDGASQAIDALRGIRLNVLHTYGTAGPLVVTVSSPSTGDGKSFVASNLALAFADAGLSTLLVDGDLRRGRLHRVLGTQRRPGLTDVLAGALPGPAALQQTGHQGLTFLACGSRTRTGPELLSSPAMTQLLIDLRARYAAILIDSPPLAAGVEPYVFGTLTGNLLVVLRLGVTDRELAEAKLDAIERLPIRVLGAVLNDVRSRAAYRRYAYALAGYELHDEETAWADGKILRDRR